MSTLTVLAVVAAAIALPAAANLVRRSDLRRMGVRNIVRRPVESVLIVVGSALGTAIIVAALLVGDTFDNSIRDIARTDLGDVVRRRLGPTMLFGVMVTVVESWLPGMVTR